MLFRTSRVAVSLFSLAIASTSLAVPTLGDAAFAVRSDEHTIDVKATVHRLDGMHCNTYLYDLPHGTDAWDKLPAFADAAARASCGSMDVWVYLQPWTLVHRGGQNTENEPYGTDFVKWCSEVAKLARKHPNIRGVVMDDFASNSNRPDWFTPDYLRQMLDAGHKANPDFAFRPVLYFDGPWEQTMSRFGTLFTDGAIVCYPRSQREVDHALTYLNDETRGASLDVELPRKRRLKEGQGAFASAQLDRSNGDSSKMLTFFFDDRGGNDDPKRGRHHVVVKVDGKEVWRRTLGEHDDDRDVTIPLNRVNSHSMIEIGIISDAPADDQSVHVSFNDIYVSDAHGEMLRHQPAWTEEAENGVSFNVSQATTRVEGRWHVPMTIMIAGAPFEHQKVFGEPGDAVHIGKRLDQAIDWTQNGRAVGVLLWGVPKDDSTAIPARVGAAFDKVAKAP